MRGEARTRKPGTGAALLGVVGLLLGAGCGGISEAPPAEQQTTTVVVEVLEAGTDEFLDVVAEVVVGGVRRQTELAQGWAIVEGVPLGSRTPPEQPVTVTAPGYRTVAQTVQLSTYSYTPVTVEMTRVDLQQTGTVQGKVTDQNTAQPVVNALVTFDPALGSEVRGFTDRQGEYKIGGIPAGPAEVVAQATGYLEDERNMVVTADAVGANTRQDFALLPGTTRVRVTGRVLAVGTEEPLAGATVKIGEEPAVQSDGSGNFSTPNVLVGEQTLIATATGYDEKRMVVEVMPGMAAVIVLMVPTSPEPPIPPHTISGTVTLIGRPDNSGATVTARQQITGETMATYVTGASGDYYLFVPPGPYRITVEYGGRTIGRDVVLGGGGRVLRGVDFTLTAG